MSDTVETDIQRVHVVCNEVLIRFKKEPLSFKRLRQVADGPFDLFLIPIIFREDFRENPFVIFNEEKRRAIRGHALEIARSHGFDVNPPSLIPGVEASLRDARETGLANILMTTGGRRFKHAAMEKHGLGQYFDEIVDRDETYFTKEQGLYYLFRKNPQKKLDIILLTGTASYVRAGNNVERCMVGGGELSVFTVALSTDHSYNDEDTLAAANPKLLIHRLDELLPKLQESGLA
jgi:phosphoglycolate phosphatase-like HAD superfamily hydrolase